MLNLIDKIGEWNPQLFRELKGRLKKSHVAIALFISLAPQLFILVLQFESNQNNEIYFNFWQPEEWRMVFISFNMIFIFTLLVGGTYLIINDLVKEERDGTLNFIRLSPQSELSIFTGKMLGVPVLIHLMIITAIPFHLFAGISANIPFSYIFYFYLTLVASCILFYSFASLFAIFRDTDFKVSKPWFASGAILIFLIISASWEHSKIDYYYAWVRMFSPMEMNNYLFSGLLNEHNSSGFYNLSFFNLPLGKNAVSFLALYLVNYALAIYWVWQGLIRCFRNPNATLIGKRQSYLLVATFNFLHLGFLMHGNLTNQQDFITEIIYLYIWNLLLFLALLGAILPHRQAIQDWATFRLQKKPSDQVLLKNSLLSELVLDEKSPSALAIAINLLIAASFVVLLILMKGKAYEYKGISLSFIVTICIIFFISLIMIYASIAQIMLMTKNSKRNSLATGTTATSIALPILIGSISSISISSTDHVDSTFWLFTVIFPYGFVDTTAIKVFSVFLCQLAILGLLNWHLIKQVKSLGESATKAIFSQVKV